MRVYFTVLACLSLSLVRSQGDFSINVLPEKYRQLEKYNTPSEYNFDSVKVYAICTGFISTDKQFPEPVFTWLIETPEANYLIDAGLSPHANESDYFKGMSKSFFEKKFDFYIYKENDLLYQLNKLGADSKINSIILTHGHFDHIGYLNKLKTQPVIMTNEERKEIETFGQAAGYQKNTDALINLSRVKVASVEKYKSESINKHLTLIRSGEHTSGHLMVLLSSGTHRILFTGDVNLQIEDKESDLYKFLNNTYNLKQVVLLYNHDIQLRGN